MEVVDAPAAQLRLRLELDIRPVPVARRFGSLLVHQRERAAQLLDVFLQKDPEAVGEPVDDVVDFVGREAPDLAQEVLAHLARHRVGQDTSQGQGAGPLIQRHGCLHCLRKLVEDEDPVLVAVQAAEEDVLLAQVLLGHVGDDVELFQGHQQILLLDVAD